MGNWKNRINERQEEETNRELARRLGITLSEVSQLDFEFDEQTSNDGLVYDVLVVFSEQNPQAILSKITGLDSNNTFSLGPNGLDG